MRIYLKGYALRWKNILYAVLFVVIALLLSYGLFRGKLNSISAQLQSYDRSDYSLIYILNYDAPVENKFIFPDTDAQVFLDDIKMERLSVSSIMKDDTNAKPGRVLSYVNNLGEHDAAVCKNVAEKYELKVGDFLYMEFPYSSDMQRYVVREIVEYNYDFTRPNIDSDIGVIFLGYDKEYRSNVQCEYIVFSENSIADTLSNYPQIIRSVISKSDNEHYVLRQGMHILIFQVLFVVVAIVMSYLAFYSGSIKLLRRFVLKGMRKSALIWIPLLEKIFFSLVPAMLILIVISGFMQYNCILKTLFISAPCIMICLFCVVTVGAEIVEIRRGGC